MRIGEMVNSPACTGVATNAASANGNAGKHLVMRPALNIPNIIIAFINVQPGRQDIVPGLVQLHKTLYSHAISTVQPDALGTSIHQPRAPGQQ
jgi:hypothetical protein